MYIKQVMPLKITFVWYVTSYSQVDTYRRFGGTYYVES
jgi:hypothetical protein